MEIRRSEKKSDRKTRKILTVCKMHHPKADVDRPCVKMKGGGRGLLQTEVTYKAKIIDISEYLNTKYKEDQFVNIVKSHKINQPNMNWIIKTAAKVVEGLNQSKEDSDTKKGGIQHTKTRLGSLKEKWETKVMHGSWIISEGKSVWLLKGDMKGET